MKVALLRWLCLHSAVALALLPWPLAGAEVKSEAPKPLPPIASLVPGDQRPLEIKGSDWSEERGDAQVKLSSKLGIFAIHLDLTKRKLNKLQLVILHERFCEGLHYQPAGGSGVALLSAEGVTIQPQGEDLVITIKPPALEALQKQPGNLQFINQYR